MLVMLACAFIGVVIGVISYALFVRWVGVAAVNIAQSDLIKAIKKEISSIQKLVDLHKKHEEAQEQVIEHSKRIENLLDERIELLELQLEFYKDQENPSVRSLT